MKFRVSNSACCYCGACVGVCPVSALELHASFIEHHPKPCLWCRRCETVCPVGAITISKDGDRQEGAGGEGRGKEGGCSGP